MRTAAIDMFQARIGEEWIHSTCGIIIYCLGPWFYPVHVKKNAHQKKSMIQHLIIALLYKIHQNTVS